MPDDRPSLDTADRAALLRIARRAVAAAVRVPGAGAAAPLPDPSPRLSTPGRAFVTITIDGDLRGCIGILAAGVPLATAVEEAATSAAVGDPRFVPLPRTDLPRARLDVSVLGAFVPLAAIEDFRPGVDGLIVTRSGRRALFLPEVATEMGWTVTEMLDAVCAKAGLPRDAWRDRATVLQVFNTQRFGGPALEPDAVTGSPDPD